jgi:hypothetical protein
LVREALYETVIGTGLARMDEMVEAERPGCVMRSALHAERKALWWSYPDCRRAKESTVLVAGLVDADQ